MNRSCAITQGRRPNTVAAAVTTVQLFPDYSDATIPALLRIPALQVARSTQAAPFKIVAAGEATTAGNYNTKVGLYAAVAIPGTPLTAANWTKIAESTARAINTTTKNWMIEAMCLHGTRSLSIEGQFRAEVNATIDAWATLSNAITGLSYAAEPLLYVCAGIDFATGSASNIGYLNYFACEA